MTFKFASFCYGLAPILNPCINLKEFLTLLATGFSKRPHSLRGQSAVEISLSSLSTSLKLSVAKLMCQSAKREFQVTPPYEAAAEVAAAAGAQLSAEYYTSEI